MSHVVAVKRKRDGSVIIPSLPNTMLGTYYLLLLYRDRKKGVELEEIIRTVNINFIILPATD